MGSEDEKLVNFFDVGVEKRREEEDSSENEDEQIILKKRTRKPSDDESIKEKIRSEEDDSDDEDLIPNQPKTSYKRIKRSIKSRRNKIVEEEFDFDEEDSEDEDINVPSQPRTYNTRNKRHFTKTEDFRKYVESEAEVSDEDEEHGQDSEEKKQELEQYKTKKHDYVDKIKSLEQKIVENEKYDNQFDENESINEIEDKFIENDDALADYQQEIREEKGELYPVLTDPKTFQVRVKIGFENEAAVCLLNKYFAKKGTDEEISIISVTAAQKMSGYIFVEATRMHYVKEACYDIQTIKQESAVMIPSKEVPMILKPNPNNEVSISKNTFVRIKGGQYANDIALVESIDNDGLNAMIKVVPRIGGSKQDGNKVRPPARLFDPALYNDVSSLLTNNPGVKKYVYKSQKYVNGLLTKPIKVTLLDKNIIPSFEQVKVFTDAEVNENKKRIIMKNLENSIDESKRLHKSLEKGDKVKVIKGDLNGLYGVVLEVNQDSVKVDFIDTEYFNEPMLFKASDLMKMFEVGNYVEVTNGSHKGLTGTIIKIDDNRAHIIGEDSKDEIVVLMTEIKKSSIKNYNPVSLKKKNNQLQKYDLLIMNDNKTVGICIAVMRNSVTIIDTEGDVKNFPKIQISQKVIKTQHAKDTQNQDIQPKCVVKIIRGRHKNIRALVKHVYNRVVFLQDKYHASNEGIIVESADNCFVLEQHSYDNSRMLARFNNPNVIGRPGDGEQQSHRYKNHLQNIDNLKIALIGQKKRICKGKLKGHEGVIKSISDRVVKFELSAKNKIISIPLEFLNLSADSKNVFASNTDIGSKGHGMKDSYMGYQNMKTPAYNPNM